MAAQAKLHRTGGHDDAPPLLLIHGFGSDRFSWAATTPAFMESHSVWAVELPGHGTASEKVENGDPVSMAKTVLEVLAGDVAEPVAIVAHSMGGAVAIELARLAPNRVGHVVLIAPAGFGKSLDKDFLTRFPDLEEVQDTQVLLQRLVANPRFIAPQMVQHVLGFLAKPGRRDALRIVARQLLHMDRPILPETLKVTVVWGDQDEINTLDEEWIQEFGEDAHIVVGAGHMPHVEQARKVNAIISRAIEAR